MQPYFIFLKGTESYDGSARVLCIQATSYCQCCPGVMTFYSESAALQTDMSAWHRIFANLWQTSLGPQPSVYANSDGQRRQFLTLGTDLARMILWDDRV